MIVPLQDNGLDGLSSESQGGGAGTWIGVGTGVVLVLLIIIALFYFKLYVLFVLCFRQNV